MHANVINELSLMGNRIYSQAYCLYITTFEAILWFLLSFRLRKYCRIQLLLVIPQRRLDSMMYKLIYFYILSLHKNQPIM